MDLFHGFSFASSGLVALLKCVRNALSPGLWFSVVAFFLFSSSTLGILYAVQYVGGGLGLVVNRIIHTLNKWRHFFKHSSHEWDLEAIDSMSALVDGTCASFARPSALIEYGFNKIFSGTVCERISWFESITLTRVFVARPMLAFLSDDTMLRMHPCNMRKVTDLCAWIVGTESLLKYMMQEGVWILVGLYIMSPLISLVMSCIGLLGREGVQRVSSFAHRILRRISPLDDTNRNRREQVEEPCSNNS